MAPALLGMLLLIAPAGVLAAEAVSCPVKEAVLPAALSHWGPPRRTVAAAPSHERLATPLPTGETIRLTLAPSRDVLYVTPAKRVSGAPGYGGLFRFEVGEAGLYRVAVGNNAWVDVLADKEALPLAAETAGPACSAIEKMLDFSLAAGRYVLEISASDTPSFPLLITRLP